MDHLKRRCHKGKRIVWQHGYNQQSSDSVLRYPGINDSMGSNIYTRQIKKDTIMEAIAYSERRPLSPVIPDAPEDFGGPCIHLPGLRYL